MIEWRETRISSVYHQKFNQQWELIAIAQYSIRVLDLNLFLIILFFFNIHEGSD